jgi:hypothetical protein
MLHIRTSSFEQVGSSFAPQEQVRKLTLAKDQHQPQTLSQKMADVLRAPASRHSPISVHNIIACMRTSRFPTLSAQCRQHKDRNAAPHDGVHDFRLHNDGVRIRRRSHEPRGYGTEAVNKHSSILQGMNTHRATCQNQVQLPPTAWLRQLVCDLPILKPLRTNTFENAVPMFAADCCG